MKITTQIEINASSQEVWKILMDTNSYPEWNPFVKSLSGHLAEGSRIKVKLPGMTFTPTIMTINPNKAFRWKGKLMIKGLFDGEHSFQLQALANGNTLFLHQETFSGDRKSVV